MRDKIEAAYLAKFLAHPDVVKTEEHFKIPKGKTVRIHETEIKKIYETSGSSVPKMPSHAIARWRGFWEPYFKVGVAGSALRIVCVQEHIRSLKEPSKILDEKVRLKSVKEEKKIDKDYWAPPENHNWIEKAVLAGRNVFLAGPAGCGKNELFYRVLGKAGKPFDRVNMDGDFTKGDFVGDWTLEASESGSKMVYIEGVLMQCMKEGKAIIVDELDAAPAEVLFTLQAVLEGKPLYDTKRAMKIFPEPGFQVLATANTVGKGDFSSLYAGTRLMNEATLDRFHYICRMDYPSVDVETRILVKKTGISQSWAKQIARLAESVRKMSADSSIYGTFSLRKSLNFAQALMDEIDARFAFKATILDRVSIQDGAKINEAANRVIDYGLSLVDM